MDRTEELAIARAHIAKDRSDTLMRVAKQEQDRLQKVKDDLLNGRLSFEYGHCDCPAHLDAILNLDPRPVVDCTRPSYLAVKNNE